ncbi:MAG: HAD family hydrolase [Fimbriimonadaceae bacterium]
MLSNVRFIYFDLDDTLCGYWDASKAALRRTFEEHPVATHSLEELLDAWAREFRVFAKEVKRPEWYSIYLQDGGVTRTEQMRRVLRGLGIDQEELAQRMSDFYGRHRNESLMLFPDAVAVLDELKQRGFGLGLMTNGPADVQRAEIATLGIGHYFDPVLIEGEVGEGKPLRSAFARAERLADSDPGELLFVGNSYRHDILPAITFGWHSVWIRRAGDVAPSLRGETAKPEERRPEDPSPDYEINELSELLALLPPVVPRR